MSCLSVAIRGSRFRKIAFTLNIGVKYLKGRIYAHSRYETNQGSFFLVFKKDILSLLKGVGISAAVVDAGNINSSNNTTFEPDDSRLKSSECLKNAAGMSVDSTSAVLSQSVYAITRAEEQYREMVNVLVLLMEYQIQVLGHPAEEERIGALIVETRNEVQKLLLRKQDLYLLFASAEKLADATAEVAFATGCEYASTSAGERLYSAQREVSRQKCLSEEADKKVQEVTVKSISAISKHEEERKKKEEVSTAAGNERKEGGSEEEGIGQVVNEKPSAGGARDETPDTAIDLELLSDFEEEKKT